LPLLRVKVAILYSNLLNLSLNLPLLPSYKVIDIIPSASVFRPTIINKSWPIELIGLRLRDKKYEVVESADFYI